MAVALKWQIFDNPITLTAFCVAGGNNVTTVISIVPDNNGKFVLFYT